MEFWEIRITAFGSSFFLVVLFVPFFQWVALKSGIVDRPGGRKEHETETALLGGAAVFTAFSVSALLILSLDAPRSVEEGGGRVFAGFASSSVFFFLGGLVLFLTGLWDDCAKGRAGLSLHCKISGQLIGIALAITGLVVGKPGPLGDLFDHSKIFYIVVFALWLVTTINSFNCSDNIHGLMSGLAVISLVVPVVCFERPVFHLPGLALLGGLLGFLLFNFFLPRLFPNTRIFLGDAGSLFVGYWVGLVLWPLTEGFLSPGEYCIGVIHLFPALLLLGFPLFDTGFVVLMRWREGRPVYVGDNQHMSHRLVRSGFSVTESVLLLWGVGMVLAGTGWWALESEGSRRLLISAAGLALGILTMLFVRRTEWVRLKRSEEE